MIFRRRFGELIDRQLDLFEQDNAELIAECEEAERAYDRASREDAEDRYAEYLELAETGSELLAEVRDNYASTLEDDAAAEYEVAFNSAVLRRLPRFVLELEDDDEADEG